MKKIFSVIPLVFILSGCAETMALLGPTSSAFGGGNVLQSSLTSAASFGIKKSTGKAPIQHAIEFAEKHNPNREKEKCINFLEATSSEVCTVLKSKIAKIHTKIREQSNIKNLD